MSRRIPGELRDAVGEEMRLMQAAVDSFDEAAAGVLGVNRTDLRCLEILAQGPVIPSVLGPALGLTTGSVTAMLDRLEKLGYLTRSPDPSDRRKVVVRITEEAGARTWDLYGPFVAEGETMMEDFTPEELERVAAFLRRSREMYERHVERVRAQPSARRRGARR
ncbi:MarR family transcriptional regulator [Nonomuraea sp. 3-1Str]|uniref:MarR family winged helix-turn-helix transcriptional regulator n=1 Tax=Nonomuraea sp. 3-1Str TaxID=2929801 RepID=UPI00285FCA6A|nr:MarR family transcriptional regulator [Nonomuraea sp. 3-1Str]MDR8413983.1 MarR family transcriptional regulator [Nonomuraea sp. 3-1Str]